MNNQKNGDHEFLRLTCARYSAFMGEKQTALSMFCNHYATPVSHCRNIAFSASPVTLSPIRQWQWFV
jgi:hypothetical protein